MLTVNDMKLITSKQQAAISKQQAASSNQQAASSKQQAASSKQQAASSKQQAASSTERPLETLEGHAFPLPSGQGWSAYSRRLGEAKVMKRLGASLESDDQVAQPVRRYHLDKNHSDELAPALEVTNALLRSIRDDESEEHHGIDEFANLGKDMPTGFQHQRVWQLTHQKSCARNRNFITTNLFCII